MVQMETYSDSIQVYASNVPRVHSLDILGIQIDKY
jgi:hypothetical protein